MKYFDSSYLVRLYFEEPGWERVRELASKDHLACCVHGRAELVAAFHRKLREGVLDQQKLRDLIDGFEDHCERGAYQWLPLAEAALARTARVFRSLPVTSSLRAADAIHLGCAAENGFGEIYSNDKKLLAAAASFGIRGENVI